MFSRVVELIKKIQPQIANNKFEQSHQSATFYETKQHVICFDKIWFQRFAPTLDSVIKVPNAIAAGAARMNEVTRKFDWQVAELHSQLSL